MWRARVCREWRQVRAIKDKVSGSPVPGVQTVERLKVELGKSKKRTSTYLLLSAYMAVILTFPDVELNYRSRQNYDTSYSSVHEMFSAAPGMFIAGFVISVVLTLLSLGMFIAGFVISVVS
ncbi:uncharacterized protein LOC118416202 [Branchiostoma floridae]|uniref:Uncharacterized protein LOC118416202 n=1 Tax=Branchiostoma floridae TaxID=7739 RepID=A0A9J7MSC1_BRAFL|nr:uncharacterized protein LOC118416202 [Branchiostoma floridae]